MGIRGSVSNLVIGNNVGHLWVLSKSYGKAVNF